MSIKKYLHLLPAAYFMALGLFVLIGSILYNSFQVSDAVYIVLLMLPILIRRQWLYGTFGLLGSIVWTAFLVQCFIWLNKASEQPAIAHHYTTTDFVAGFVLCSVSAFFSAALLYQACYWQQRTQVNP